MLCDEEESSTRWRCLGIRIRYERFSMFLPGEDTWGLGQVFFEREMVNWIKRGGHRNRFKYVPNSFGFTGY